VKIDASLHAPNTWKKNAINPGFFWYWIRSPSVANFISGVDGILLFGRQSYKMRFCISMCVYHIYIHRNLCTNGSITEKTAQKGGYEMTPRKEETHKEAQAFRRSLLKIQQR
jgi:hypothetical protein